MTDVTASPAIEVRQNALVVEEKSGVTHITSEAQAAKLRELFIRASRSTLYAGRLLSPATFLKFAPHADMLHHIFYLGRSSHYERKQGGTCYTTPIFMKNAPADGSRPFTNYPMFRFGSREAPLTTTFPLTEMFDVSESVRKTLNECTAVRDAHKIVRDEGVNALNYDVSITGGIRAAQNMDAFRVGALLDELCIRAQAKARPTMSRDQLVKCYIPLLKPEFEQGLSDKQKIEKQYPDPIQMIGPNNIPFDLTAYFKVRLNFTDPESPMEGRKSKRICAFRTKVKIFDGVDPETKEDKYIDGSYHDLLNTVVRKRDIDPPYRLSYFVDFGITACETTIGDRFRGNCEASCIYIVPSFTADAVSIPDDMPLIDVTDAATEFLAALKADESGLYQQHAPLLNKLFGLDNVLRLENGNADAPSPKTSFSSSDHAAPSSEGNDQQQCITNNAAPSDIDDQDLMDMELPTTSKKRPHSDIQDSDPTLDAAPGSEEPALKKLPAILLEELPAD